MTHHVVNVVAVVEGLSRAVAGHHRRAGSWTGLTYLLTAIGIIAVVWGGLVLWERWRAAMSRRGNGSLFDELARTHSLSSDDCQLLRRAAELAGYEEPALAFVRPEALDGPVPEGSAAAAIALRERLFGERTGTPTAG